MEPITFIARKYVFLFVFAATAFAQGCGGEVESTAAEAQSDAGNNEGGEGTEGGVGGLYDCFCTGGGTYQVRPPSAALHPAILDECKARCGE